MLLYLMNEITLTSGNLINCGYESDWISQPEETKKTLIILCEALKQPQMLMIYIYPLDLETFKRVKLKKKNLCVVATECNSLITISDHEWCLLYVQHSERVKII